MHGPQTSTKQETKSLEALDLIHERAQVTTNLQLSQGKRLKLESPRPTKRKRRPPLDFNVSFTNLADPVVDSLLDIPEVYDDSEDGLPMSILPINTAKDSSDTVYPGSDIDDLIRALPDEVLSGPASSHLPGTMQHKEGKNKRAKYDQPLSVSSGFVFYYVCRSYDPSSTDGKETN